MGEARCRTPSLLGTTRRQARRATAIRGATSTPSFRPPASWCSEDKVGRKEKSSDRQKTSRGSAAALTSGHPVRSDAGRGQKVLPAAFATRNGPAHGEGTSPWRRDHRRAGWSLCPGGRRPTEGDSNPRHMDMIGPQLIGWGDRMAKAVGISRDGADDDRLEARARKRGSAGNARPSISGG